MESLKEIPKHVQVFICTRDSYTRISATVSAQVMTMAALSALERTATPHHRNLGRPDSDAWVNAEDAWNLLSFALVFGTCSFGGRLDFLECSFDFLEGSSVPYTWRRPVQWPPSRTRTARPRFNNVSH
jgi:hypothetical protein